MHCHRDYAIDAKELQCTSDVNGVDLTVLCARRAELRAAVSGVAEEGQRGNDAVDIEQDRA